MTQNEIVLNHISESYLISRIEIHKETGICQNSLGVVLMRLTKQNEIEKIDDGIYGMDEYFRIREKGQI